MKLTDHICARNSLTSFEYNMTGNGNYLKILKLFPILASFSNPKCGKSLQKMAQASLNNSLFWSCHHAFSQSFFSAISASWKNPKSLYIKSRGELGPFARTCNPSKWEADIWGWLEVRRSAMLHFNERQRPHWACRQYGHTGGTRGWLGVERWQLCLQDTSRSANCHRRAAVGHWISLYVKCCRMVDSVPIWHTISIL